MKKVLSLVLVLAMVLSSMSFAFAGTFTDVATDNDYEDAINALVGLGVVTGYEDGTFRPEKVVTRAEMAKLIVEILGYGDLVAGSKSNFSDTQGHWADAYIALAAGKGLVVGTGNGKFDPDRTVSYDESITMVVRALGYTDNCNEIKNMTWPTNFKVKAAELKLTKDVTLVSTGADRGGVAQLLYNALEATLVTVNSDGDVVKTQNSDKDDVLLLSRIATEDTTTYQPVQAQHIDSEDKAYAGDIVDLTPYMYQDITVYTNDDDEVVYVKSSDTLVLEGVLNDDDDVNATSITVEDVNEDDYTFNLAAKTGYTGPELMLNGEETTFSASKIAYSGEGAPIKVTVVLDADDDDKLKDGYNVIGIVAEKATDEVRASKDYVAGRTRIGTISLPLDNDDDVDLEKITVVGDVTALEDIKEDSIVTAYAGLDKDGDLVKIKLAVSNSTVNGKITKTNYDVTNITIDGTSYDQTASNLVGDVTDIDAGEEGTLFLNAEGYYFEFELESESEAKDYAVVIGIQNGVYSSTLKDTTTDAKVRLATQNDEEIVYTVADEADINGTVLDYEDYDTTTVDGDDISDYLAVDKVVEYSLDDDGNLESIDYVTFDKTGSFDTDTKAFILSDNVVIFDGDVLDKDENTIVNDNLYQILSENQLEDTIKASVIYNKDGELELVYVINGAKASVGTYAIVNNVEKTTNDSGKVVYAITAYVDGTKVTYLSDKEFYADNSDAKALRSALRGGFKLVELAMDGEVITDTTLVTTSSAVTLGVGYVEGNVSLVKANNDVVKVIDANGDEQVITLADDAIVYLQTGTATVEVTEIDDIDADSDATATSTQGDVVKAIDTDDDEEYDILVIKER